MKKLIPVGLAATLILTISLTCINYPAFSQYETSDAPDYSKYYEEGLRFYNNNEFSKAIEQFTQALKMAPNNPAIRNNLAVCYISRGTYYHNNVKDYNSALENYLEAIFYLKYDITDKAQLSANAPSNLKISIDNAFNAIKNAGEKPENPAFFFKKGRELRAKGSFRAAISAYNMALEKSPNNTEAQEALGDMYRVLQNTQLSTAAYQKALSSNQSNPQLYVKTAQAYEKAGDINAAIKAYNTASSLDPKNTEALNALQRIWENQIKINPRNAIAHANLGVILQKKGDLAGAETQYNTAGLIDPNNTFVRLNLGTLLQAKGDLKTAIKAYDTILQIEPRNSLARYYKATALRDAKNYDAAIKELNTILQYESNNDLAKKELVNISQLKGESTPEVVNILKDIADKNPTDAKAQYDAGFEAHSKGNIDMAIAYYKKAIALNPNMADAYSNLGAALLAKKAYAEAKANLEKASTLDPTNKNVDKLLAEINDVQKSNKYQEALTLHQQGKPREAITLYEEAYKSDPNNAELLTNLGAAYQSIKNYDAALDKYRKATIIDPKSAITFYYMANAYSAKNLLNEAISNYKKAVELDPQNSQYKTDLKNAQQTLANGMLTNALDAYNNKLYPKAQSLIQQALTIDPENSNAYYYLGLVMEAQGNITSAIGDYKKAIQLDPKFDSPYYALGVALDKNNDKAGAKDAFNKFIMLEGNKNDPFVNYAKARVKQL